MSSTYPVSGQADTLNLLQTTTWLRSQLGDCNNYPSVADTM